MTLDRSPEHKEQMIESCNKTCEIFDKIDDFNMYPTLNDYEEGANLDTVFTYKLDDNGRLAAKQGLKVFTETASMMLIFNSKIESITIKDLETDETKIYRIRSKQQL